jgi:hypothetical protein
MIADETRVIRSAKRVRVMSTSTSVNPVFSFLFIALLLE